LITGGGDPSVPGIPRRENLCCKERCADRKDETSPVAAPTKSHVDPLRRRSSTESEVLVWWISRRLFVRAYLANIQRKSRPGEILEPSCQDARFDAGGALVVRIPGLLVRLDLRSRRVGLIDRTSARPCQSAVTQYVQFGEKRGSRSRRRRSGSI